MTAWAIGQTGRFGAALMSAGISDWGMLVATGENGALEAELGGSCGWEGTGPHPHDQVSPISFASKVDTPVLIVHGEDDTNVPLGQAIYFHRALSSFGAEHELVVYPREGHGLAERNHQLDLLRRAPVVRPVARRSGGRASMMTPVRIAPAVEADLPGIVEIFNYTAANSIANFGTRPVSVADRRDWVRQFSPAGSYRLFVARRDGQVMGYAGSQRYRRHEAFSETVEVTIALQAAAGARALGRRYRELFSCLAGEKIHVALAGIALPNDASVALHRKFGFTEVGTFCEYAVKDGQYISSRWLQRLAAPA